VAGDEVYGRRELRRGIRQRGMGYVMAVRANHVVTVGSGRAVTAVGALCMIPARAWYRMRTGSGTKGTRLYDWAMLEVTSDDTPDGHGDGHSVLLIRRHRRRSSACQAEYRPGHRAGHPLEVVAPLDRDLPACLHLPRGRRRFATPA
jgi:hypothetical protein